MRSVTAALLATGCVRVLEIDVPDTAAPRDEACIPADIDGFSVPNARWALAALHAEANLDRHPGPLASIDAEYVLATAWQSSGFGCDDYGPPWFPDAAHGDAGCMNISSSVVWEELCRLYPGRYACDAWPDPVEGDQVEAQVMAFTWFAMAAHGLMGRYGDAEGFVTDPDVPDRFARVLSVSHFRTPWFDFESCDPALSDCLDADLARYLDGVLDKTERLSEAGCWDGTLTEQDVTAYVAALEGIQPDPAWAEAGPAALDAVVTGDFRRDAPAVVEALLTVPSARLVCPEQTLQSVYRLPCP